MISLVVDSTRHVGAKISQNKKLWKANLWGVSRRAFTEFVELNDRSSTARRVCLNSAHFNLVGTRLAPIEEMIRSVHAERGEIRQLPVIQKQCNKQKLGFVQFLRLPARVLEKQTLSYMRQV
jgi:hypothetical protein